MSRTGNKIDRMKSHTMAGINDLISLTWLINLYYIFLEFLNVI